jgi:hypothetical protein
METKIIQNARPSMLPLVGGLGLALTSLIMALADHSGEAWKLWACASFFGLLSIPSAVLLFRGPERLVLDRTGLKVSGGFALSPQEVAWTDVEQFFVASLPHAWKSVCYRYRPEVRGAAATTRLQKIPGADGVLPRLWKIDPEELVSELNAYRERASRQTP